MYFSVSFLSCYSFLSYRNLPSTHPLFSYPQMKSSFYCIITYFSLTFLFFLSYYSVLFHMCKNLPIVKYIGSIHRYINAQTMIFVISDHIITLKVWPAVHAQYRNLTQYYFNGTREPFQKLNSY